MPAYNNSNGRAPTPNLENLRKQAKLYLRCHRERYYPLAVQIRSVLARFADLSDREVLDAGFSSAMLRSLSLENPGLRVGQR